MNYKGLLTLICSVGLLLLLVGQHQQVNQLRLLEADKSEFLNIRYGLLSLDEWKSKSYEALRAKIYEFNLNTSDQAAIRPQIESLLYTLLDEVEMVVRSKQSQGNWWQQIITSLVQSLVLDFNSIRQQVPHFTDQLLRELGSNANQGQIKDFLARKIYELLDMDTPRLDAALQAHYFSKYNCSSYAECGYAVDAQIIPLKEELATNKIWIYIVSLFSIILFFVPLSQSTNKFNIGSLVILASILLIGGLIYPTISINARIMDFNFKILGMDVHFGEQVLFYKSKSIYEIVVLLIQDGKMDTVLVGALILLFSVLFPITKLVLSLLATQDQNNPITNWLTTKASKWSMADVFVVAIFMAFIGLRGVIGSQIASIQTDNPFVDIIATDYTSLELGFSLFMLFCISSLALGLEVKRYGRGSYL